MSSVVLMMSGNSRQAQLTELQESSQHMLELALAGDWDAVRRLQQQQHNIAQTIFSEPVEPADAAAVAVVIKAVIDINEQVSGLGVEAREGRLTEASEQQHRRHALQQYTENSG